MNGDELRQAYLDFFEEKGHLILPSAPLVPEDDPTLLWINAGMAPFKPYFDGRKTPPATKVATSQKCIRTVDIENVGKTKRHQTFFEMLGNFSFGDYFKKEAITWAWEFVTEVINLDQDRLWITIYEEDEEAFAIWHNNLGIPRDRILRMDKKENYWQIGTGPCGPCSEIHYDRGPEYGEGPEDVVAGEGDRFLEIWNLVFTQYDYTEDGEYLTLPSKNIDTGMGLERVASILQDVDSNYETDLLWPMITYVQEKTGIDYKQDEETTMAYRVIADHIRGVTMAIFDGVLPENEGRGYVIRRLLRRAVRYGGKLGFKEPFLYKIVPVVNRVMAGGYPEIKEKEDQIQAIVRAEEERFLQTLDQGLSILNQMLEKLNTKEENVLPGNDAFKLYDTYGFPLDLTKDVIAEKGFSIDEEGFKKEMKKQRQRARAAREEIGFSGSKADQVYSDIGQKVGDIDFLGYDSLEIKTEIVGIIKDSEQVTSLDKDEEGKIILKKTPFYAESGGQTGDKGVIENKNNQARVTNTFTRGELIVHQTRIKQGEFKIGQTVTARVDEDLRKATARNHSCTHILHQALKEILGDHVNQSGSLVTPDRLRFDFNHYSALTKQEIEEIEKRVNTNIIANYSINIVETSMEKAKEMGAIALFGEKYGEQVRVVKVDEYSTELCGGTHISFTGEIGLCKIVNESSVAAGMRRIEAVTGFGALAYLRNNEGILEEAGEKLKVNPEDLISRIEHLLQQQQQLKQQVNSLRDKLSNYKSSDLLNQLEEVNGVPLLTAEVKHLDNEGLRKLADQLKNELDSGIIVLASNLGDKVIFVNVVTEDLVDQGFHAGNMIGKIAQITGGGGGGRPDMAQAGGNKADKISEALAQAKKLIAEK